MMVNVLSPPKVVLLAIHLAANADVDSLASLTAQYPNILQRDLILRILLSYLPETLPSEQYVDFLQEIMVGQFAVRDHVYIDDSVVQSLSDETSTKKVRKLKLLQLPLPDEQQSGIGHGGDAMTQFLLRRAHRVDEEAGMLTQLPSLLTPFLPHAPTLRTWLVSSLIPLLRRNYEYYPNDTIPYTVAEFQKLPDLVAVGALLSSTGANGDYSTAGRDLRGLIGPWLHNDLRWIRASEAEQSLRYAVPSDAAETDVISPGWEKVLEWLTANASDHWQAADAVIEQWEGPEDVDLGEFDTWLGQDHQRYLDKRYARSILACAYLVPENTIEALEGSHRMVLKAAELLDEEDLMSPLQTAAEKLVTPSIQDVALISSPKNTTYMRDDLLSEQNPLTTPSSTTVHLLHALVVSAFIKTRSGLPCHIKRAGDLAFIQDEREQKAEAIKLIHAVASRAPRNDDEYWTRARREILWLRDWGCDQTDGHFGVGIFGRLKPEFLEAEILKSLLSNGRYSLARHLYEDDSNYNAVSSQVLEDTIVAAALHAYDNASNPNRTRGGLKKCDEIINAFPRTITKTLPSRKRIDALLKSTHALSEYRLVLKQGEPFSPVVLRVHSDPISIISKVLEQNPGSYTNLQDFLEVGYNMVKAGLTAPSKTQHHGSSPASPSIPSTSVPRLSDEEEKTQILAAEKRITAMCIQAALAEDDFETAYSYIVSRLAPSSSSSTSAATSASSTTDDDSWRAALLAGQYARNAQTVRPTHLGTASGNLDIRHLEQRIECLSTALRIAPRSQLQEILKTFRRCEEQLDSAFKEEAAREAAEDDNVMSRMPGGFASSVSPGPASALAAAPPSSRRGPAGSNSGGGGGHGRSTSKGGDEAPMSLFDLSRAAARTASRNFSALSALQASAAAGGDADSGKQRVASAGEARQFQRSSWYGGGSGSGQQEKPQPAPNPDDEDGGDAWDSWGDEGAMDDEDMDESQRVRKRDQFREAAMGTLTSGVGWLIGAPAPPSQGGGEGRREGSE